MYIRTYVDIDVRCLWKQAYMESLFARMLQGMALFARLVLDVQMNMHSLITQSLTILLRLRKRKKKCSSTLVATLALTLFFSISLKFCTTRYPFFDDVCMYICKRC